MSTPAQIEANQANARHSTGPRTPEGKAASATNATRHGFFSRHAVLLNEEEHRQFESLRNSYVYTFSPANIVEVALLDQLVLAAWGQHRRHRPAALGNQFKNPRPHLCFPRPRRTDLPQVPQRDPRPQSPAAPTS